MAKIIGLTTKAIIMMKNDSVVINGRQLSTLALGTWLMSEQEAYQSTLAAIRCGYRHVDTAQAYENEAGVGKAVRECGLAREDIYVTSKVAAEIKNYAEAARSIDLSLERMQLDYIDLMLIHCPLPWDEYHAHKAYRYEKENREVWRALEDAFAQGKVRAIGISNFSEGDIDNIMQAAKVQPMVNQIHCNALHTPNALIRYCRERNIVLEAYSPIAHGSAIQNQVLQQMAKRYNVSVAQWCIRYCQQLGMIALPKSTSPEHIRANMQLDFQIKEEDIQRISQAADCPV